MPNDLEKLLADESNTVDCNCRNCTGARSPLSRYNMGILSLKDFAEELWKKFNDTEYSRRIYAHLQLKDVDDLNILNEQFSSYMAKQVQYYVSKHCLPHAKLITGFGEGGNREAASYLTFHNKKNERIVSVDNTYLFLEKPVPHIVYIDLGQNRITLQLMFHNKNKGWAEKYLDEIKDSIQQAELYKGALIQIAGGMEFLYDVPTPNLYIKRSVREEIELNYDFVLENKEKLQANKLPWRRGILLYGYPGTGKTQLCKQMALKAKNLGVTTIWVTSKSIHSNEDLAGIFKFARNCSPTLLIFEDIDLFAGARDEYEGVRGLLGEFLQQLDGIASNDGIFVAATTNRLYVLDKAISDRPVRFDAKIELDYNDFDSKKNLIELYNTSKLPIDASVIAHRLTNVTPAHIQELMIKSSMISLQRGEPITTEEVLHVWNQMRPSSSGAEVS